MLELDPQIAGLLAADPPQSVDARTLPAFRAAATARVRRPGEGIQWRDHVVPGSPEVLVRVHRPLGAEGALPCVYSMHGGGYVMGGRAMDDRRLGAWCRAFRCVGVSVEYRLAPETPFPGPLEDCYLGLRWVHDHHRELGVDPDRVGLSGTSAGAGLAAALAMLARDRGEVPLRFQVLDAPMIDDRQLTASSRLDNLPVFDRRSSEFGWRCYLGPLHGSPDVPPYAAPARATDLAGLPPAYVCVGGADGFRDEAVDYATRLDRAGVPTELHVHPGAPHGVKRFPDVPVARRYLQGIHDWIGHRLRSTP